MTSRPPHDDQRTSLGPITVRRVQVRAVTGFTVAVLTVAVLLRFNAPAGLWLDEAQSVAIARLPLPEELVDALRQDGSPPLYYLLLHAWMAMFGAGDLAVRSLSGVLSIAALPLAWLAGRRLGGGRWTGWATLMLTATNPWMLRYASEARMYALLVVLALAGLLLLDRLRRRPTFPGAAALAGVSGALVLTHYWSFFLVAAVLAGLVLHALHRRARWAVVAATAIAAGALLFLPWLPAFAFQLTHTGTPWAGTATLADLVRLPRHWAGTSAPLAMALLGLLILGVAGTGRLPATAPAARWLAAALVSTVVLGWSAAAAGVSAFASRYTAVVVPLALLLAAYGAAALPRRYGTAVVAVVAVVGLVVGLRQQSEGRTQAPAVASELATAAGPGDVVAFCPDQLGPAVARELAQRHGATLRLVAYPHGGSPERVNWVDYARRNAAGDAAAFAARLDHQAGASARVFLVQAPYDYRTLGSACTDLPGHLDQRRGPHTVLVPAERAVFEQMRLLRWSATAD